MPTSRRMLLRGPHVLESPRGRAETVNSPPACIWLLLGQRELPCTSGCVPHPPLVLPHLVSNPPPAPANARKVNCDGHEVELAWHWDFAAPAMLMLTEVEALTRGGPCPQGT